MRGWEFSLQKTERHDKLGAERGKRPMQKSNKLADISVVFAVTRLGRPFPASSCGIFLPVSRRGGENEFGQLAVRTAGGGCKIP
jgi:hypothetical protein